MGRTQRTANPSGRFWNLWVPHLGRRR
jgi:hypothetical protein